MNHNHIQSLLRRVPQPPNEPLPAGATDADLDAFENETDITIPTDLRAWLLQCNGPCVGPGGIYGIKTTRASLDMRRFFATHPNWKRQKLIPVAGDGCGNVYVMPTSGEFGGGYPICFFDMMVDPDRPAYLVASSLERFLTFLLEQELAKTDWPFKESYVTDRDPEIKTFHGVPLPWMT